MIRPQCTWAITGALAAFAAVAATATEAADPAAGRTHAPATTGLTRTPASMESAPRATTTATPLGDDLALVRYVVAGGGGHSDGGAFVVQGTIGQVDADPLQPSSGGVYTITGGFWAGMVPGDPPADSIFADGFEALSP